MQLLFFHYWISDEVLKALCWTLIHSLWQGLLAAAVSGIIIISTRKSSVIVRYNLLCCVLFLLLMTNCVTFYLQITGEGTIHEMGASLLDPSRENSFIFNDTSSLAAPQINMMQWFISYFNENAEFYLLIWTIFFIFKCTRLFTGLATIHHIRNHKTLAVTEAWKAKVNDLCNALHIRQSIGLLQSGLVKVPVAVGFFKPVILLPFGLVSNLPVDQVESIILHELAHIRRRDYMVNLIQRFAEAIFFFNPALLWISSLIRQEREACCDDIVVANTINKGSYLEALVSFQEYSLNSPEYAMALGTKQNYLLNRVKRILTRENKKLNLMEKSILLLATTGMLAFGIIPKNEIIPVKRISIKALSKMPETISFQTVPVNEVKPAKKRNINPVLNKARETDTVPPKMNRNEKINYKEIKFPSISSTINDDGKNRSETTSATDQDGKKYSITKMNGQVTLLTVDGVKIDDKEISNYAPLFQKIDFSMQQNMERRQQSMEQRQQNMELKQRIIEKRNTTEWKKRLEDSKARMHENEKRRIANDMQRVRRDEERLARDKERLISQKEQADRKNKVQLFNNDRKKVYLFNNTKNKKELFNNVHRKEIFQQKLLKKLQNNQIKNQRKLNNKIKPDLNQNINKDINQNINKDTKQEINEEFNKEISKRETNEISIDVTHKISKIDKGVNFDFQLKVSPYQNGKLFKPGNVGQPPPNIKPLKLPAGCAKPAKEKIIT